MTSKLRLALVAGSVAAIGWWSVGIARAQSGLGQCGEVFDEARTGRQKAMRERMEAGPDRIGWDRHGHGMMGRGMDR